jgi:hypothetical protein
MGAKQSATGVRRPALTPALLAVTALVLLPGPLAARASAQSANSTRRHLDPQGQTASWSSVRNAFRDRTATGGRRNGPRGGAASTPRYTGQQAVPPRRTSVPRATVPGAANVPGSAPVPGSTDVPGSTGVAPGSTSSLTTSTSSSIAPSAPSTPALATPSATSKARTRGGGFKPSTPAIALAVLAGLLLLLVAAWALARAFAYEPAWMPSLRHSFAEAGFRASATWAELGDWLRLGR